MKIAYILFAVLHMHPLLGQNVNDIDNDPYLRNWLFIGPFKDKNIAKKVSDSLITLNNSDIFDYVNKRDDLSSHFITSKAPRNRKLKNTLRSGSTPKTKTIIFLIFCM